MLSKIAWWSRRLTSRYPADARVDVIRHTLKSGSSTHRTPARFTVAVQCLEDRFYYGLFGAMCQRLSESVGAVSELVVVRSISGAVGVGLGHQLARSTIAGWLISSQWVRAFKGIASGVAYRSLSFSNPLPDVLDWVRSDAIWRAAQRNDVMATVQILGVEAGDLIIDSYLRFRPAPRFEPGDPFVRQLIWQAHRDVRRARVYFRRHRPHGYLTSYSTYIEHGIAVRVALQEGVRVKSFGNFSQFAKELTAADWFHTPDTSAYRVRFDSLDRQDERLAEAEAQLRNRLSGGIDNATSYMRASAYSQNPAVEVPDASGATVVFLHDFYDSPHVYDRFIFDDFWSWACFTIDALMKTGRPFFVKPHPNQISLSGEVLRSLTAKYPNLPLITSAVTSVQLAQAGMICGATAYGTVAHELAYLGVPTISCAKHPHHAYDFCRTASTQAEYAKYLSTPQERPLTDEEMRRQALSFYYMHNLYGDAESLALKAQFAAFWKACHGPDTTDAELEAKLNDLRSSPAFRSSVDRIGREWAARASAGGQHGNS